MRHLFIPIIALACTSCGMDWELLRPRRIRAEPVFICPDERVTFRWDGNRYTRAGLTITPAPTDAIMPDPSGDFVPLLGLDPLVLERTIRGSARVEFDYAIDGGPSQQDALMLELDDGSFAIRTEPPVCRGDGNWEARIIVSPRAVSTRLDVLTISNPRPLSRLHVTPPMGSSQPVPDRGLTFAAPVPLAGEWRFVWRGDRRGGRPCGTEEAETITLHTSTRCR